MLSLYYKIWADAITAERANKEGDANWKYFAMAFMSILQGINLLALMLLAWLLSGKRTPVIFPMHIFDRPSLNSFCAIVLTYFIPFVIINYLLIFYNNNYQSIVKIYGGNKGKLFKNYALISVGVILIPLIIKVAFFA